MRKPTISLTTSNPEAIKVLVDVSLDLTEEIVLTKEAPNKTTIILPANSETLLALENAPIPANSVDNIVFDDGSDDVSVVVLQKLPSTDN